MSVPDRTLASRPQTSGDVRLAGPITSTRLVAWMLEQPGLVAVVQGLDAPVLRKLVDHVGLEDAGEIVSLATAEQLERVFDDDLWKSGEPGRDETFDAKRFALWLEVLLRAGEDVAVEKVAAMDEDLLAMGLLEHVLVVDIDAMAASMAEDSSDEHDMLEKALESCLYEELEEFRVIARDASSWDPIVALLVGLDENHHALLRRILERCCAVTTEYVDDNGGLYDVLTGGEMLASDVAGEREQRREREGFVAPSTAASFLRLARVTPLDAIVASHAPDPVTKAHMAAASPAPPPTPRPAPEVAAFVAALRRSGVLPETEPAVALLAGPTAPATSAVQRALGALREADPRATGEALSELAYLVNVLVGAAGADERALRPIEALETVSAVCSLGLTRLLGDAALTDPRLAALVESEGLVKAFRIGWHLVGDETWTREGLAAVAARALEAGRGEAPNALRGSTKTAGARRARSERAKPGR